MIASPAAHAVSHDQRHLRARAAGQLRVAISEGRLQPGEWLRQERLARELGVSHMPVREALKEVATEGLIDTTLLRDAVVLFLARCRRRR